MEPIYKYVCHWAVKNESMYLRNSGIYRILPRIHVEEFFDTGKLRLSSFKRFSMHPDEEKGDTQEGVNIICGRGKDHTFFTVTGHGYDAYVLSGSQIYNDELCRKFKANAAIKINDTTLFGSAVAASIVNIKSGLEGTCEYRGHYIERVTSNLTVDHFKSPESGNELDLSKLASISTNIGGPSVYFSKRGKYIHQQEYRWIWIVSGEVSDYLDLECPEARQYCEKII